MPLQRAGPSRQLLSAGRPVTRPQLRNEDSDSAIAVNLSTLKTCPHHESPTPKSSTTWLLSSLLSIAVVFGFYVAGTAGDCKPGEIDGQCGMSSFFGIVDGVVAGLVIFLGTTSYLLIVAYRRRALKQKTERLKSL